MKELQPGKMTLKELSEWFGLKPETLSKSKPTAKEKKFKILKIYADYHFEGKKIVIDRVKIPVYSKALDTIKEAFSEYWGMVPDGNGNFIEEMKEKRIDTCSRVGAAIHHDKPEVKAAITESTAKIYVNVVKNERYGRLFDKDSRGTHGHCEPVYLDYNNVLLTEEQEAKRKSCYKKAYADFSEAAFLIDQEVANGLMT